MRTRDSEKQQRIKEAMVRLVLEEGMSGASVAKIAREAGVSPATIYVYYESKEDMLAEVFREYSHESYHYLKRRLKPDMGGGEFIETLIRGCYTYSTEHEEIFSFVEQCSRCPTLSENVSDEECFCDIFDIIHKYQSRGVIRRCSDSSLAAVLFAPVRFIAACRPDSDAEAQERLNELVDMLKSMLLY